LFPIFRKNHLFNMTIRNGRESRLGVAQLAASATAIAVILIALLLWVSSSAQVKPGTEVRPSDPLPVDTGVTGLKQMLVRLNTTGRMMQTTAHPDDEDGGMLTYESRGKGASVVLLTLNRGEGGQNKVGSNLFDVLGVLRTLELTAADRYYGVEQRFTRVADFGYSKSPEETFEKWQGHDIALGDMVRVIRQFHPDVLVARFSGTDRDGHGHHQASSILTREAFRAAADPNRFPEQIKEGLQPWQARKIYIGNVCGFGAKTCPDGDYTLRLNTGEPSPLLGMSYVQFAMKGLKHQLSQGAGAWSVEPGDRFTFYKLVDSVVESPKDQSGHEKDFFDGIDTSVAGLANRLGADPAKATFVKPGLVDIQSEISEAGKAAERDPQSAASPLLAALKLTHKLAEQVRNSTLSAATKQDLLAELFTKEGQLETAADLASGTELHVSVDTPVGANADDAFMAVPGQSFEVTAHFTSKAKASLETIQLDAPAGWKAKELHSDRGGSGSSVTFRVTLPADAQLTRPYWHRANPETDAINTIDDPQYLTLPFSPSPLHAHATYQIDGKEGAVRSVAMVKYKETGTELERALAVAPAFSVALEPGQQVIRTEGDPGCNVKVGISNRLAQDAKGTLRLEIPAGWRVEPASVSLEFHHGGELRESQFTVFPASLTEGRTEIRAVFEAGDKKYSEGYSVVTRDDLSTFYYYQPAAQRESIVDVKIPKDLKVGYIMGAGDDIPTVLEQLGMNVTLIAPDKLATENLSGYGTIVLGIRAYDTQKDLAENNQKLLDFVSAGGTLVVQYNASVGDFNSGKFTPYPAQLSRARVSVEAAPVEILAPDNSVFHSPNPITARDFDGWVQERGLYFMDQWDDHFKPLLSCHDPGESPQKGGLLRAQYGKGTYIYAGYAFFRQLPAGVPGAIRLYVNLLSAGH
jgi:LmbE family N-acetylglucosaminyl deacetylase